MPAVIYARYSTDMQSETSVEDQLRQCRERAERDGHEVTQVFSDYAISGSTLANRPGMLSLMDAAKNNMFDIVYAEALDRISRDQEDIAGIFKRLTHEEVCIITLSEGLISELHVGLKGTMNALFLKDLAIKTRRGLEGRVRQGKSGGGNSYGYDVVKKIDANGEPVRGHRAINTDQALIVQRIFDEFVTGRSPRAIAVGLNSDNIPGPRNGTWGASTIHGNWRRGTGILNNDLYIGRLVWNRQRFIKDPVTGKRQARMNAEDTWIIEDVPELRIIADQLWQQVKGRQEGTRRQIAKDGSNRSERARRPRYLLSGLLECGVCGGGFSKISQHHYGCSIARNKGTCMNRLSIRRDIVEAAVLGGLKDQLMQPDAYKEFVAEFNRELNRIAASEDHSRDTLNKDIQKIDRDLSRLIEAIKSGVPGNTVKDEIVKLEASKVELKTKRDTIPAPKPRLHPNLADVYRNKVANLVNALNAPETVTEAAEAIRDLIEAVRLTPEDGSLKIELYGELSALLTLGQDHKNKHPRGDTSGVQVTMVAGVGFEPTTFRL